MKKKKPGRPLKYPFDRIKPGKCRTLKVDNPRSCQSAAHIYAAKHDRVLKTSILPDGVKICDRTECE